MGNKLFVSACVAAMLGAAAVGKASAQTSDERAYFTFKAPVEVPGATLAPGRYLFRLSDPTGSRNTVQVVSEDGKHIYAMFATVSRDRLNWAKADKPEVRFMEAPKGEPQAVKSYWYSYYQMDREFVYPKQQARRLAQHAKE